MFVQTHISLYIHMYTYICIMYICNIMHNTWLRCKRDETQSSMPTNKLSGESFQQCLKVAQGQCDSYQSNAMGCQAYSVMWAPKLQHLNGNVIPQYTNHGMQEIKKFRIEMQNGPDTPLTTVAVRFEYAWPNSTWSNLYGVNVQCVHLGSNLQPI